ncbi:Endonuclease-reverse transcriptase [Popillia japonica]|uniref:Endonuclease-reverse transcriptase n=1 Tax=Popillia japonica TaxID=7064 RepID=A0AAW1LB57_POPJA
MVQYRVNLHHCKAASAALQAFVGPDHRQNPMDGRQWGRGPRTRVSIPRGELLTNFLAENGLTTLNRGNKPTFETASRAEVIDITVSTPRLAMWVKQWHVSDEPSLSDHRYVRFDIELPQVSKPFITVIRRVLILLEASTKKDQFTKQNNDKFKD